MTGDSPRFSDDPVQDRARLALLEKLAANTRNAGMAELARELLAGHVTPRQIVSSQLYANVLETGTNEFSAWYGSLSEDEKATEAAKGEQATRNLADPTSTPPAKRNRSVSEENTEDFSERNWLRGS
jgi:hypothetical protein